MNNHLDAMELASHDSPRANAEHQFELAMQEISEVVAPVWPLKDYVAVNPYFGLADRSFMSARSFLKLFSSCETLMPLAYYADQWCKGLLEQSDIEHALDEIEWPSTFEQPSASEIVQLLNNTTPSAALPSTQPTANRSQPILRTIAAQVSQGSAVNWSDIVVDEITKFCSEHYDEGQASWSHTSKQLPLYVAWREMASIDRNMEILGIQQMRDFVRSLPEDPKAATIYLLTQLEIPHAQWSAVLLCQAFSIPGWSAWAKYQDKSAPTGDEPRTLVSLLALRLAYDVAIGREFQCRSLWKDQLHKDHASFATESHAQAREAWVRFTLLRASEIHYRQSLLNRLTKCDREDSATSGKFAQMVFCIDVRSERIRRQIETLRDDIDTLGFAGFFGVPMEYLSLGESQSTSQLPVLLKPQFCVHEQMAGATPAEEAACVERRISMRSWRKLWQNFKSASISSFGFVEASGLLAAGKLISQSLGVKWRPAFERDGVGSKQQSLRPEANASSDRLGIQHKIDLAYRILTNLGLTKQFARLVVLCGHRSDTHNNPLAASLDCGACGGHAGSPNSRWLALVLNRHDVRQGLQARGICIPADTSFVAAIHNTTTDAIEFFDEDELASTHRPDLETLHRVCQTASAATAIERAPHLNATLASNVMRRAADWSEVRPEWGLAGNVAFVVGPRSLTRHANLDGRVFLHSYDHQQDKDYAVLETIMTAPMIVANWINMQYYASTVDNRNFGSGSKTVHNVVGKFGILSGNAGDLRTGLPTQSLHTGKDFQHDPKRLLVVICAPRSAVESIISKHELLTNLVSNQWISIVTIEDSKNPIATQVAPPQCDQ